MTSATVTRTIAVLCTLWRATNSAASPMLQKSLHEEIIQRPPVRDGNYLTFAHHHVRTNRETSEHYMLSYKLRRHSYTYVDLDDTLSNQVEAVFCEKDELQIDVAFEIALGDQINSWTYPTKGRLIYGGQQYLPRAD